MKRLLITLILSLVLMAGFAVHTTGAVTTATYATDFQAMTATTTLADSALALIPSSTFNARFLSNKVVMVQATVTTSITNTSGWTTTGLVPTVYLSIDGTNWVQYVKLTAYQSSAKVAGTVITFPLALTGIYVPYIRIGYTLHTSGTEHTTNATAPRPLVGAIKTVIVAK